jgi:hypothetical protein
MELGPASMTNPQNRSMTAPYSGEILIEAFEIGSETPPRDKIIRGLSSFGLCILQPHEIIRTHYSQDRAHRKHEQPVRLLVEFPP